MLVSIFLLSIAQQPVNSWVAPSASELLTKAGVVHLDADKHASDQLALSERVRATWRSSDPRIEFLSLPFAAPYLYRLDSTVEAPHPVAWGSEVAAPAFLGAEPELVLRVEAGEHFARGTLKLFPAKSVSASSGPQPRERQILGLHVGCALSANESFPITIGETAIEIELEWDLRSPIPIGADQPSLETNFGERPSFSVRLEGSDPLVEVPARLLAGPGVISNLPVRSGGSKLLSTKAYLPPCIRLAEQRATPDGDVLSLVETELANSFHHCPAIVLMTNIESCAERIERRVEVIHQTEVDDGDGRPLLFAAVIQGETVELWARGDETHLAFPDRIPCSLTGLRALGYESLATHRIPDQATHVDMILGDAPSSLHLQAIVGPDVAESFGGWAMACGQ